MKSMPHNNKIIKLNLKKCLKCMGGYIMSKTSLIIIGGFLGSGKTTAVLNLANLLKKKYKNVGVITNNQGTQSKKHINVMEVTDECLCCNLDSLSHKVDRMIEKKPKHIMVFYNEVLIL